tara:strand:+ start:859 stop:2769 length:1911 start_codon:yes stop_codon:yes gene_type:complete
MVRVFGADGEESRIRTLPGTGRLVPDAIQKLDSVLSAPRDAMVQTTPALATQINPGLLPSYLQQAPSNALDPYAHGGPVEAPRDKKEPAVSMSDIEDWLLADSEGGTMTWGEALKELGAGPAALGRDFGNAVSTGADAAQGAVTGGLDAVGSRIEAADRVLIGDAPGELLDNAWTGSVPGAMIASLLGLQSAQGDTSDIQAHALSNPDIYSNEYIQMLLKKKDKTPAEKEALVEYLMNGGINRGNDIMAPPEILSGQYDPYNPEHDLDALRQANRNLSDNRAPLNPEQQRLAAERAAAADRARALRADDPIRDRPLIGPNTVQNHLDEQAAREAAYAAAQLDALYPLLEGGNAMGLAEQLAASERGYAQGRYNDLRTYLDTERARAGAQFDSDEEAIINQLQRSDADRKFAEGMYTDRRQKAGDDLQDKFSVRTSAANARLKNLGIDPAGYTNVVGKEMGALIGAQMQSGADLASRMAMLGAQRAQLGMGRARSGMAKERRGFDRNAADMLFQGSQRLSYELQDIDKALMNRRITAEQAKSAAAEAASEARQQANRAAALGPSFGIDPVTAATASSFDGILKELISQSGDMGTMMTITEGMLPEAYDGLIGRQLSLKDIAQILSNEKTRGETQMYY